MQYSRSAVLAIGSLVLMLPSTGCGRERAAGPNVVLISIDTLRPDHLHCYGYERETSPNIDRLAAEGVRFTEHISSAPWTLPAHAAMFTSVPDTVHGCVDAVGTALAPEFTTLAERFQSAGYATGGFFAGPYLHPAFGLGQGFEVYADCGLYIGEVDRLDEENRWSMEDAVLRASHHGVTNDRVFERASEFLEEQKDGPFFAFVHLWDVHFDFVPPPPYDTLFDPDYEGGVTGRDFFYDPEINAALPDRDKEHLVALYDGEIRWTDEIVGRIRSRLEALGHAEDTVIVITSDHGTELFDHGGKGHRTTLYDEQIRIPLVVWYPPGLEPHVVTEQTRMVDLGPTLLELADLPAREFSMGESLVPLARGSGLAFDNVAVSELISVGRNLRSVRHADGKYVFNADAGGAAWWDLSSDQQELSPMPVQDGTRGAELAREYTRVTGRLQEAMLARPGAPRAADLPEAVRASLRANGYVGDEDD